MSTENPTSPAPSPSQPTPPAPPKEIRLYSHSSLFYWWPVWAIGFILAIITYWQGYRVWVTPVNSEAAKVVTLPEKLEKTEAGTPVTDDINITKDFGKRLVRNGIVIDDDKFEIDTSKTLRTSKSAGIGVFFLVALMVVVIITNVPLRGMWSVLVIVVAILGTVIFALAGWWDDILDAIKLLDIRISMGGYLMISIVMLVVWLATILLFDRQIYITFTPGQMKVHLEIGGGEISYDTRGMTIKKERSDMFRHWVLGLGSGDLIIRTSGADAHEFRLPNVLFVGRKHKIVEEMQQRAGTT